ncbi:MAG: DUF3868 domain-containing protein [Bacteroidia bacterium]|nr:DUF3868 domain-containing protein [Bacteroidia bacterium]
MKKKIYIFLSLVLVAVSLIAQVNYSNQIAFNNQTAQRESGNVNIQMDVDISNLEIRNQHMVVLTPVLNSVDGVTQLNLPAIVVTGKTRGKALSRAINVAGKQLFTTQPHTIVTRKKATSQIIPYQVIVPLENWMRRATLTVKEEVRACADCPGCELGSSQRLLSERLLPEDFKPTYQLTYLTPEVEEVKQRSESHEARLNFKAGKADILPDFGNNAAELAKVDKIIRDVQNDKDLTITALSITGYASPEGNMRSNMDLSQRRANAFADYLSSKYNTSRNQFKVAWHGEDWVGLKKAVEASSIADKQEILNIINTVSNLDARDAPLRRLSKGSTYKTLLETYYPPLRRNEYTIAYVARPFDVNEAKAAINTRPQLLSLNEMFHVAQSYPKGSAKFKEVFDIAARMYPNNPVANMNAATVELEGGNVDGAIARLDKFKDLPQSWNNLAIALIHKQKYQEALSYLDKAAARGDATAKTNAEQLRRFLEDQK